MIRVIMQFLLSNSCDSSSGHSFGIQKGWSERFCLERSLLWLCLSSAMILLTGISGQDFRSRFYVSHRNIRSRKMCTARLWIWCRGWRICLQALEMDFRRHAMHHSLLPDKYSFFFFFFFSSSLSVRINVCIYVYLVGEERERDAKPL